MLQDVNLPLDIFNSHPDPCSTYEEVTDTQPGQQAVLGKQKPAICASPDETRALYPRRWDWSLVPARYRLWELFYAHRDYFWRIGLCVPGGDQTG
jgi:triacylglycerol lipase